MTQGHELDEGQDDGAPRDRSLQRRPRLERITDRQGHGAPAAAVGRAGLDARGHVVADAEVHAGRGAFAQRNPRVEAPNAQRRHEIHDQHREPERSRSGGDPQRVARRLAATFEGGDGGGQRQRRQPRDRRGQQREHRALLGPRHDRSPARLIGSALCRHEPRGHRDEHRRREHPSIAPDPSASSGAMTFITARPAPSPATSRSIVTHAVEGAGVGFSSVGRRGRGSRPRRLQPSRRSRPRAARAATGSARDGGGERCRTRPTSRRLRAPRRARRGEGSGSSCACGLHPTSAHRRGSRVSRRGCASPGAGLASTPTPG